MKANFIVPHGNVLRDLKEVSPVLLDLNPKIIRQSQSPLMPIPTGRGFQSTINGPNRDVAHFCAVSMLFLMFTALLSVRPDNISLNIFGLSSTGAPFNLPPCGQTDIGDQPPAAWRFIPADKRCR